MVRSRSLLVVPFLAALPLFAGDYDALLGAMKKAWPQVETVAVVCDSNSSKGALSSLTSAAGGFKVLVIDVKGPQDMGKAIGALSGRKPDAVILLAGDKVAGDGSSAASFLIQRMAALKVPTAATTEAGVKQGAALGIGPGTGGKLLANAKVAGVAGVAVPAGATAL
ncbi:hypothetical protein [Geothrix sp. 21YS21S-4]|uniref:hypothetical protein n=1 Tax=Geothrix sp. 21YS21S-4 TaxID=3068889 RepID=UPI0027B96C4E|nr:hypothetical protein [Geothrix sp. 21YS21S-4]